MPVMGSTDWALSSLDQSLLAPSPPPNTAIFGQITCY